MLETQVQSPGQKDPLEKEMAAHSSIPAWSIPWIEEPSGLQSMRLQIVRHNLATKPPPPSTNVFITEENTVQIKRPGHWGHFPSLSICKLRSGTTSDWNANSVVAPPQGASYKKSSPTPSWTKPSNLSRSEALLTKSAETFFKNHGDWVLSPLCKQPLRSMACGA